MADWHRFPPLQPGDKVVSCGIGTYVRRGNIGTVTGIAQDEITVGVTWNGFNEMSICSRYHIRPLGECLRCKHKLQQVIGCCPVSMDWFQYEYETNG